MIQELNLPTTRRSRAATANQEWARQAYEAVRANAQAPVMRTTTLAAPAPPMSDRAPSWRTTKPEKNPARANPFGNLARLPRMVLGAMIVYSLGMPIFWFALMDLILFSQHGVSLFGPALDFILMVFGMGLVVVPLVAVATGKRKRATSR